MVLSTAGNCRHITCALYMDSYVNSILLYYRINLGDILLSHKLTIVSPDRDATRRITVCRNHLLNDTLKMFNIQQWNLMSPFKVTFLGEPGIDDESTSDSLCLILEGITPFSRAH